MALLGKTAAIVALAAMLSPAPNQTGTIGPAGAGIELAYWPWAKSNQSRLNGDILLAGARHPRHPRYSPPPPGNRWRNALLTSGDESATRTESALT